MSENVFLEYKYDPLALASGVSPVSPITKVEEWIKLKKDLAEKNQYLVGSWGVWKDQADPFVDCVTNIVKDKGSDLKILRLGISAPEALGQELNLLKCSGVDLQNSKVAVIDFNKDPLTATKNQKQYDSILVQGDARYLPFSANKYNLITAHFLFSYPQANKKEKAEEIGKDEVGQEQALLLYKNKILSEVYRCLNADGTFIMAQGIGNDLTHWKSIEEILNALVQSGFDESRIKVIPTTDPYDHEEVDGKLVPKKGINYIFVAKK